ncbi:unnamed protein product [Bursaphelenchus xylophilus]|uniref:(pine wood nematode) hypothetical protein n=1 Tax=Bursaphelenchus xylophilus TaxID=6326 RepID=A0A1I7SWL0_BURXY|nr:unnamed protein product [Bursaphelenchus xylophilus]CAG9099606.1 unnamed protein product [Bursaphelenchus xylophilus]
MTSYLLLFQLIHFSAALIDSPSQYLSEFGVITLIVGPEWHMYNLELTTLTDEIMVFGRECVGRKCLAGRDIVGFYDGPTYDRSGPHKYQPGLESYRFSNVPLKISSLKFEGNVMVFTPNPKEQLDSHFLEQNTFNIVDGYFPMRFGGLHVFDSMFKANQSLGRFVTFVPSSPTSASSGLHVGHLPDDLCDTFKPLVIADQFIGEVEFDVGLMTNATVRHGGDEKVFNVFLQFGPWYSFSEAFAKWFFGDLAFKNIPQDDFYKIPEEMKIKITGLNITIPTTSLFKLTNKVYNVMYKKQKEADIGLSQRAIRDKCIRIDKIPKVWMWGLSQRL